MILHGVYVLHEDPPVFTVCDGFTNLLCEQLDILPVRPHVIVFPTWSVFSVTETISFLRRLRWRGFATLHIACATEAESRWLNRLGFSAHWCNQNLFCNEGIFTITRHVPATFDAAYTAAPRPYKRLHLASGIKRLRLISGDCSSEEVRAYLASERVCHARVDSHHLNKSEVATALNSASCGLALSSVEGGMLAVTEYLLCGLPVVSTPSRGGRDIWFSEGNHRIVDATSSGVQTGVDNISHNTASSTDIRRGALRLVHAMRTRLVEIVHDIVGIPDWSQSDMSGESLLNRFISVHDLPAFLSSYDEATGFSRPDLYGHI